MTHLINVYQYLMGGNEEEGATIFSVLHSDRQWVETEAQDLPSQYNKTLLYWEGG